MHLKEIAIKKERKKLHKNEKMYPSDPPRNTAVLADPSGPLVDGSSVTLTCTSVANPAVLNFSWFRTPNGGGAGGEEAELVASQQHFSFNVTKLSEDQFYCRAANDHGSEYSHPVSLDVTCETR